MNKLSQVVAILQRYLAILQRCLAGIFYALKRLIKTVAKRHTRRTTLRSAVATTITLAAGGAVVAVIGAIGWFTLVCLSLPQAELNRGLSVFDRHDHLICTVNNDEAIVERVDLNHISKWVPKALVECEDRAFYEHNGVSFHGIVRAMVANVNERKLVQGGSTITQQLAKNVFFAKDGRNFSRKLKDAAMALAIERKYSKKQILEAYLNTAYFGTSAYGIERAARTYFGKNAKTLTLAESAYLVGLVNAPSRLSNRSNLDDATKRQRQLLKDMEHDKLVSEKEAQLALAQKIVLRNRAYVPAYTYYVNQVLSELHQRHSDQTLFQSGLKVFTCMDCEAQRLGTLRLSQGIKKSPPGVREGALVSIAVSDGGVLAIVGGVDGVRSQWNRALSPHMAGSAFKPFVYLAGLTSGKLTSDSMLLDAPITPYDEGFKNYNPQNYDGTYLGWISTRKAIAMSRNTCAVRVTSAVGPQQVVQTAARAGIRSKMEPNLSIALGACSVSPMELAAAYSTLARGGAAIEPHLIRRVETINHRVIENHQSKPEQVFDAEPVAQLVDALQDVVEVGTGTRARLLNRPAAGKTGTSDGPTDIWFVGFTTDVVTAVWGGNDEFKPISGAHVTGGTIMARIWHDYMAAYYNAHPTVAGRFQAPEHPLIQDEGAPGFYEVAPNVLGPVVEYVERKVDDELYDEEMPPLAPPVAREEKHGHRPKFLRRVFNFLKSL